MTLLIFPQTDSFVINETGVFDRGEVGGGVGEVIEVSYLKSLFIIGIRSVVCS
jgi:hypothetical protein